MPVSDATSRVLNADPIAEAVLVLGTGFLSHPDNGGLRDRIRSKGLSGTNFTGQLHWVVYRMLALFVAQQSRLLPSGLPGVSIEAMLTCDDNSSAPIGGRALRPMTRWAFLIRAFRALACDVGDAELGLPGLGASLWACDATPDLYGPDRSEDPAASIDDRSIIEAARRLGRAAWGASHQPGLFRGGSPTAIGDSYESLLGLMPHVDLSLRTLTYRDGGSHRRKTSGTYYTPEPLVEHLLDSALQPLIDERVATGDADAVLSIRVCDPAVGSGRFLIGAARRIGLHLAHLRSRHAHASDHEVRDAIRDVIDRCVFGVDLDPLAVELCKFALWLECDEPGRALASLDRRVRVGNALLGTTPELIAAGIPDDAFAATGEGSVADVRTLRNRNRLEHSQGHDAHGSPGSRAHDPTRTRLSADAWCSAFLMRPPAGITDGTLRMIERQPGSVADSLLFEVERIARDHRFFHWHLEFPEVFDASAGRPGFDAVVGNPPFLNQLEASTVSARGHAAIIRTRTAGAVRGYADAAAAFLMLGVSIARDGGRVALVQPQSLLVAKDAGPVRAALLDRHALEALWVSNERVFRGAAVYTCAPTVRVGGPRRGLLRRSATASFTELKPIEIDQSRLASQGTWAPLTASARGIPEFRVIERRTLRDIARATADFRDQYYGLDGFLVEDDAVRASAAGRDRAYPAIVTTGLIDPAVCRWGSAATRLLKQRWSAPRIDRARMEREGGLGSWIEARLVPKVLIATQTRVLEVFVDSEGAFVPSTPLISVMPYEPDALWRIAAAVASPVCSAISMERYAGAALHADAIKLSAKQVAALPLPTVETAWDEGAASFQHAQQAGNPDERVRRLHRFGETMCAAYQIDPAQGLMDWWRNRL